jgi:heme exporter protein D
MIRTARRCTLLDKLGIGGISLLVLFAGVIIHINTLWRYRLVLRDEPRILGAPAPFVYTGALFSLIVLFIIWVIAADQNRRIGWGVREGRTRASPLQWEDVILCVVPGVMLGTIGTALFINSYFDRGPEKSHISKVTQMYTRKGSKGGQSYYMCLADWKNSQSQVNLAFDCQTFNAHRTGEQVVIKTKHGFLGYEWITNFM